MTPERWEQVSEVLDRALRLSATERSGYFAEIAGSDPELRLEVESLLSSHEAAGTEFLNSPAMQTAPGEKEPVPRNAMLGRRLGAYQIVELLGEGGMGEVYRAFRADDQYRKQVALKVVRGGQDSSFVISRFKNERQILASLDHPNIAHLLDGGTTEEGAPYFVMDLIEGESIDQYCDRHKLVTSDRLKLFLQVCSAVQFAHQRLIIHRDVKPSNILVTVDGVPKLLDFGIAKILDPGVLTDGFEPTLTQFRALTPCYASPEQIKGEPITTASDGYSLGVVLYELLTGSSPYGTGTRTAHDVARAVCELEPEKPSTVARRRADRSHPGLPTESSSPPPAPDAYFNKVGRRLEGDLDNIVLMALRKEPQRRYSSIEQFAEDIRRHLENLPVIARKDTASYRASKFITRHKAGVAATAAVAVILIAALLVTLREARIARQQAELARSQHIRAERRFNDVRALANSLMFEIHDSIRDLPGSTPARKLLVDRALQYLDSLSAEGGNDPSLMRELASAYERVGDVQGFSYRSNLGDTTSAMRSYQKALAIREALAKATPKDQGAKSDLANSYEKIANVLFTTGETVESVKMLRGSLAIRQILAATEPSSERGHSNLATCYDLIGDALTDLNDWPDAMKEYQNGLAGFESLSAANPESVRYRRMIALSISKIGFVYEMTGEIAKAQQKYQKSVAMLEVLVSVDSSNALLQRNLSFVRAAMGATMIKLGDSRGIKELLEAAAMGESLSTADPADMRIGRDLALTYSSLGDAEKKTGNAALAARYYSKALARAERRSIADPQDEDARVVLAQCYRKLGELYEAMAGDVDKSTGKRRVLWQNARSWFQKDLKLWLDRKTHAPASSTDIQRSDEIQKDIGDCDTALVKLRTSDSAQIK
jgi:non-specific serine/threonine protein kinase/serine/threonine-protein kinase